MCFLKNQLFIEKALWIKRRQSKYFNLQINNKDEKNPHKLMNNRNDFL